MPTVLVKICGLSTVPTLEAALEAGADMIGLVFFPKSPRHVDLATARGLAARARGRAEVVALTVDATDEALDAILENVAPDWLQLHGGEPPERVAAVRSRTGLRVMKALGIADPADLAAVADYATVADRVLFDAKAPKGADRPGGNGEAFDWTMLRALDPALPFMLSGGLTLDNVGEAVRLTGAPGVDVSSGVESAPGIKDVNRIRAFVAAARGRVAPEARRKAGVQDE